MTSFFPFLPARQNFVYGKGKGKVKGSTDNNRISARYPGGPASPMFRIFGRGHPRHRESHVLCMCEKSSRPDGKARNHESETFLSPLRRRMKIQKVHLWKVIGSER